MLSDDELRQALRRAFDFGQRYWQQADSESYAENRRSDETLLKFKAFTEETVTALGVSGMGHQTFPGQTPLVSGDSEANKEKG